MRRLGFALAVAAALTAGGASAHQGAAARAPDSIEVVFHPGTMFWSIEDGGTARFKTGDREDYTFAVTHEDYVQIRELMEPYRAEGLRCDDPAHAGGDGYLVWRKGGDETRRPHESLCYTEASRVSGRSLDRAYNTMRDWADARWQAAPGLPDPQTLTLTWQYWGRTTSEWTVPRGGEARWSNEHGESKTFAVTEADFDGLRDIFRPYEGRRFECERVITDGAYGHLTWSQPDHEDQQLKWDTGCVTGDAADVFERVDQAVNLLKGLRDR